MHGNMAQVLRWLAHWIRSKHGLEVKLKADEQAEPQSHEVKVLLFQAVRELLFNTVKHAKVSEATVEFCRLDDQRVRVVVRDEGAGFDPEVTRAESHDGSGFGLFAIRERLDWLGGEFQIHSRPGQGTCAILTAPIAQAIGAADTAESIHAAVREAALPGARSAAMPAGPRIRVLLADDHIVMRDGLGRLLERLPDVEVIGKAADGQQAVDLAGQLRPDVVIMDVNMPGLDGVEATRRIKAVQPRARVIGLSMFNEEGVAEAMVAAGTAHYMPKRPVRTF